MSRVTIATCMPEQRYDRRLKKEWLANAVDRTDCDLFLTPQEYFGGLYIMPTDMHIEREWLVDEIGTLAGRKGKAIGVGAVVQHRYALGVEEYLYFDKQGELVGSHRKMGLPSYDDEAKNGAGRLWPEKDRDARLKPVELLGLRIGTIFCWEVFSLGLFPGYAQRNVTLVVHPIKFAPAAWPVLSQNKDTGEPRRIERFEQDPTNSLWLDKLYAASRHEVLCPIAVTCNSWALGPRFSALVGVVDALRLATGLCEFVACNADEERISTFSMDPQHYQALFDGRLTDVFKDREDLRRMRHWTMHRKMRKLGL